MYVTRGNVSGPIRNGQFAEVNNDFAAEQAQLQNMGEPPLRARPATAGADLYLKILAASVAWLAIPVAAATVGVGAAGLAGGKFVAGQVAANNQQTPVSGPDLEAAPPSATPPVVAAPPGAAALSFLMRLLAFAFPR